MSRQGGSSSSNLRYGKPGALVLLLGVEQQGTWVHDLDSAGGEVRVSGDGEVAPGDDPAGVALDGLADRACGSLLSAQRCRSVDQSEVVDTVAGGIGQEAAEAVDGGTVGLARVLVDDADDPGIGVDERGRSYVAW